MENIVLNEKGEVINLLEERNKELEEYLEPHYEKLYEEYIANLERKKPLNIKFGNRFTQFIIAGLSRYPLMTPKEFMSLTAEDLQEYYQKYMELITQYNVFEISSTKQLFCAYMRITVPKFNQLASEKNTDVGLREYAIYINDNINGLIFSSAETGNIDSKSALSRAKIKGAGQDMFENAFVSDLNVIDKTIDRDELYHIAESALEKAQNKKVRQKYLKK